MSGIASFGCSAFLFVQGSFQIEQYLYFLKIVKISPFIFSLKGCRKLT